MPALGSKCIFSEGLAPREMSSIGRIGSPSTRSRTVIISLQFLVLQAARGLFHARNSGADACRRLQTMEQQLDLLIACSPDHFRIWAWVQPLELYVKNAEALRETDSGRWTTPGRTGNVGVDPHFELSMICCAFLIADSSGSLSFFRMSIVFCAEAVASFLLPSFA